MGSIFSKTNEDNTDRVTNVTINFNCFNSRESENNNTTSSNSENKK